MTPSSFGRKPKLPSLNFFFKSGVRLISITLFRMKSAYLLSLFFGLSLGCGLVIGMDKTNAFVTQPTAYLSPEEQAKTFVLPQGYRLELVVSDPIISEPVAVAFDGDGRMFVAEMRTYMQDIDGNDQHLNKGCVSLHWSSKRNGVFDRHSIFADNLVLPRMILPVADGLIINETDSNDLWLYTDTNNDGVADRKTRIFKGGKRGGNLEHQQSGLIWNLDNWLYMTVNDYRLRLQGTNVIKEATPSSGGQWGMSRDDYGKPWFVNAGGEIGPLNFQQPFIYGRFSIKGELTPGFKEVWPLIGLADVQGGEIRFRPQDKTLNHFTATCGGEIFRGDRLPKDLRGDFLFAEPVGRLIRRTKIEVKDGVTYLKNAYDQSEFIRSTDPNFRPVNLATAPDGTLYIVDMYRGIIQEGNWVKPDSYLRKVVQQYELEKNFGRGRIWRLVHNDFKPGKQPRLQHASASQLVRNLDHPNGWWRDTAQKLLVQRCDEKVVPSLEKLAQRSSNHLERIHALWTLEGLDALTPALLRANMADAHPQVRIAAVRASESLYIKGDHSPEQDIRFLSSDSDPSVVIQAMLTANFLKWRDSKQFIDATMKNNKSVGVQEIGMQLLLPDATEGRELTSADKKQLRRGSNIYGDLCFACHGYDGKGMPLQGADGGLTMAPSLAGSKTVTGLSDQLIQVILKGLTGPVDGKSYDAQMVAMDSNDDEWIAAVASYVRNSFGNNASLVTSNHVARARGAFKDRTALWTLEELRNVVPQYLTNRPSWKVSASHKADLAANAVDDKPDTRYDTAVPQEPGMWFQIELPEPTLVSGLYLDCATSPNDFPRKYKVELSDDGEIWGKPVATGAGNARTTEIHFDPATTKFIRLTQTGTAKDKWWSIHELHVLRPPDPVKVAAAKDKRADASGFE